MFIAKNCDFGIKTSPLTSNNEGGLPVKVSGILLIVFRFKVIFSPVDPLPLVAPLTNIPFSYSKETANPSNFNSQAISNLSEFIEDEILLCQLPKS